MKKLLILYVFTVFVYIFSAQTYGLIDPDEPRYAATAKNMVVSGDYIVPYFNGKLRINKPPLTYWLVAGSYKFFNINELSARLPQIVLSLFFIFFSLIFLRNFFSEKELLYFLSILSSLPIFFYLARYCNTDMIVTVFFGLSLILFYKYFENSKNIYLNLFYLTYLLANLSKGPVAYLIILILTIFLVIKKDFTILKNYKFWFLILIISLTPALYLIIVNIKTGGEFGVLQLITRETAGRFLKGYRHPEPIYFYLKFFPILFFPWSIFFILNIGKLKELWHRNDLNKLSILWFFVILIFFSISKSKLISYILPLSFPFSVITAQIIAEKSFRIKKHYFVNFLILTIAGLSLFLIVKNYNFPEIDSLLPWAVIVISGILFICITSDTALSLSLLNLIVFLTIFIFGADFINNNKSEKVLENIKEKYKVVSYRRDLTGIAFYYGDYIKKDNIQNIAFDNVSKILIVSYKTDFKRIKNKMKFKKIVSTKRMIAAEVLDTNENYNK